MSWPIVNLGDVCQKVDYGLTASAAERIHGPRFLRITDMQDDTVDWDTVPSCECSEREYDQNKLAVGDIVFARTGATTGKSFLIRHLSKPAVFASYLIRVRPSQSLDPIYLSYFLKSSMYWHQISTMASGAAQPGVNSSKLKELRLPLPPLPEQKRIAAILDKADTIRRKRQQAIQLADDFLRAVFLDIFGDSVTNPYGLRKGSITELAEIITGNAFKSDDYIGDSVDAVRLCRGTNVLTSYFDWSDTAYWPKDKLNGLERYLLSSGDVILAMDRPWISSGLKVCVFPGGEKDTYLVQRVARLRPREAALSEYVYSCIKSMAFEAHCCPTETTVPHISPVELRSYEVLIPDTASLLKYNQVVAKVKSAIAGMQEAAMRAGDAFGSMSQKAFTGQL
ncbi:hypothetical protein AQS70_09620 [Pseudomonas endophytica]|uniref:Type I restriction modification DNA specificity domain-containing protein n=1 Tax=Pseudomonas endophytica TaxID=1563157 RepID=A0A0Q0YWG1_9PSED|nr:restriction endonuclease subunit S [Pseudomonas endophytica]KQB53695.1 hypothetical protein AQS70_09620 [Pseudomonas endophytica]